MNRDEKGFTLIELLVVIAIIAILAAMLFPVFARARESARKIQCLANVKNIATAVQMYLADYDRFPPEEHRQEAFDAFQQWTGEDFGCGGSSWRANWGNPFLRWPVILDEYVRNRDVWRCPSAKWDPSSWWIVPNYMGDYLRYQGVTHGSLWKGTFWAVEGESPGGSYCVWAYPSGWGGDVTDSIGQQAGHIRPGKHPGMFTCTVAVASLANDLKTSQIGDAARYVVVGDGTTFGSWFRGATDILFEACGPWCGRSEDAWANCPWSQDCSFRDINLNRFWSDSTFRNQFTRHLGGSNVGFADGHASWYKADALLDQSAACINGSYVTEGRLAGLCPS